MANRDAKREFRILGPFEVREHERPLPIGRGKQRALLAVLILNAGELVSTDRLIDELWGESPPASAPNSVHIYVSQLRKALGNGHLVTRGHGYVLDLEPGELDLDRFECMLEEGRQLLAQRDFDTAAQTLRAALALWRGSPLADFAAEPFAQREIARLAELRLAALEARLEADLWLGRHAEVVAELDALTTANPLRERFWAQLMLALYRAGRQSDALSAYQKARRVLAEAVGLVPGPELRRLEKAILAHDSSLELEERIAGAAPVRRRQKARRPHLLAAAGLVVAAATAGVLLTRETPPGVLAAISPDSIGIVDPKRDALVGEIRLGTRPAAVAFGAGALWVATYDRETLLRIDPRTKKVDQTIGLGVEPSAIAVRDGYVWVLCAPAHLLLQFDDQSGRRIRRVTLTAEIRVRRDRGLPFAPFGLGGRPFDLDAGAGAAWVAYVHAVSRVDAETGAVKQIRAGSGGGIGFGEHAAWAVGKLWFDSPDEVSRIDPKTLKIVQRIPSAAVGRPNRSPNDVAAGAGAVWTISQTNERASKVDPGVGIVSDVIPLFHRPLDLAIGEGAVWTANDDGTVSRIDPRTATLSRTIPLGDYPRGAYPIALAAGGGAVWVAVH